MPGNRYNRTAAGRAQPAGIKIVRRADLTTALADQAKSDTSAAMQAVQSAQTSDAGSSNSGAAGGDLAGRYPNPTVAAIHETGGPTKLTAAAIPASSYLKRVGATIAGETPAQVAADIAGVAPKTGTDTIALAKLTAGGTNGSYAVTYVNGLVTTTVYTAPT